MRRLGKVLVVGIVFIGFCICPKYIVKTASAKVPALTQTQYNISASSNWQAYSNTSDSYIEAKNSKYSRYQAITERNKSQPKQSKHYWDYSKDDPMYWKLKAEYAYHQMRVCQTSGMEGLQDNAARWATLYKTCVRNYRRLSEKQPQNNSSDSQKEGASKKTTPPDRRIIPPNPVKMEPPVDAVKKGLADMLDVKPENIEVVSSEQVWWPNTSLGFGEPDKFYAQVMVPGYKIILKVGDKKYEVHTGGGMAKVEIDDKVHTFRIANTFLPIIQDEEKIKFWEDIYHSYMEGNVSREKVLQLLQQELGIDVPKGHSPLWYIPVRWGDSKVGVPLKKLLPWLGMGFYDENDGAFVVPIFNNPNGIVPARDNR